MKDVASRAGVALKTVSRVVNSEPGVRPETTRRVLGAIEDLGFRRNESARLLRTGRTATLGYIADTSGRRGERRQPAAQAGQEHDDRGRDRQAVPQAGWPGHRFPGTLEVSQTLTLSKTVTRGDDE